MTPDASRRQEIVDGMLLDAGQFDAPELRAALFSLGSFASLPAPAPSAELAALMAGPQDPLARRCWLPRHRPAVVGLAVIAGMGLGVSGVAATGSVQGQPARTSIQHMLQGWGPSWAVSGVPSASAAGSPPGAPPASPPLTANPPSSSRAAGPRPAPPKQSQPPASPSGAGVEAGGSSGEADQVKDDSVTADADAAAKGAASGAPEATGRAPGNDAALSRRVPGSGGLEPEGSADHVARELQKAQKLLAGTAAEGAASGEMLKHGIPVPALTAKTGAKKNVDLGAQWLKKFSH
ncbi:hypothetical protein J7E83_03350 [Arthrobacter sp. ISL-48]|uniref:hypothetical protein n=1 Tax=Arthrobacter sp. ISL-48 TaxID=2819110 RepID=UPI001BE7207F|nr:hypothetical protein [Arthrobacter sp. ISL-48]MBT2531174.1 hypothetical protein [Arthrobacter sp. ISL-48]